MYKHQPPKSTPLRSRPRGEIFRHLLLGAGMGSASQGDGAHERHRFAARVENDCPADTRRAASWRLPHQLGSVPKARHLTRALLSQWGFDGQGEVAELLVSELVTNALKYVKGTVDLSLSAEDGLLRFEVEDANPELPQARTPRPDEERGHGLHLVDTLSCCWGSIRTHRGKVVWCELPVGAPQC
ncbi:ATP-binding protein [Nonomuraea sp. NPDC052129]|uniref:ATP-binding protein n=1 Tax=Nonomuraea sp. NPDC052129 TaxID=3154651 RepID=UPI003419D289